MTTGQALATLRCRAQLTKTEVAQMAGVSVHVITALERDQVRWNADLGSRLLTVLAQQSDVAVATLLDAQDRTERGDVVLGVPVRVH